MTDKKAEKNTEAKPKLVKQSGIKNIAPHDVTLSIGRTIKAGGFLPMSLGQVKAYQGTAEAKQLIKTGVLKVA